MRTRISIVAFAILTAAALPAKAEELSLVLDSYIGVGTPTAMNPGSCLPPVPNCVLFTGTLTDNDVDPQPDNFPSYLFIGTPYTLDTNFAGILPLDISTAPGGVLSGDATYMADAQPATSEYGPVFGVDIPVGTPVGVYEDTVYLDITPYDYSLPDSQYEYGPTFTVSAPVIVVVAPEPATPVLFCGGLAALAAFRGVRRKWPSYDTSR